MRSLTWSLLRVPMMMFEEDDEEPELLPEEPHNRLLFRVRPGEGVREAELEVESEECEMPGSGLAKKLALGAAWCGAGWE